ncbi:hypothetical protein NEUTE2DRAFT_129177 [Neurospora tetrasperma FGSC 2509]|nr:hypothetical protein NEUTE2DRAFT_129177 [Neurospora tetrasperma FGSC 2509]
MPDSGVLVLSLAVCRYLSLSIVGGSRVVRTNEGTKGGSRREAEGYERGGGGAERKNQSAGLTVYPGGGAEILGGYNVLLLGNCSVSKDARARKARKCRDAQRAGAGHTFHEPPMNPQGGSDAICAAGAQSMPRERHLTGSKLQQQSTVRYRERRSNATAGDRAARAGLP